MKTLILILTTTLIISCSKNEYCDCGVIESVNDTYHTVVVRNECSGNVRTFVLRSNEWSTANVGTDYCLYDRTW